MLGHVKSLLREWAILGIGALFVVLGLATATYYAGPMSLETTGQNESASPKRDVAEKAPKQAQAPPKEGEPPSTPTAKKATGEIDKKLIPKPEGPDVGSAPSKQSPGAKNQAQPQSKPPAKAAEKSDTHAKHDKLAQAPAAKSNKPAVAAPAGDVAAGRQAFSKCQACHSMDKGKNLIGPSLAGVIGRKAAQVPNYNYSPAMSGSNVVWNSDTLDAFLLAPQKFIPKNKMAFPGIKSDSERANVIAYLASASSPQVAQKTQHPPARPTPPTTEQPDTGVATSDSGSIAYIPDVRFTVRSGIAEGRMVYIGVGGTIDGQVNPILSAAEGQVVQVTLLNGEGAEHDIVFPDQKAASPRITGRGTSTVLVFRATKAGDYIYYCGVAGHRQAGMEGQFLVTPRPTGPAVVEADISQLATEVPTPIGKREPQTLRIDLVAVELEARLAEGTTFGFWTFNGRVPGPMLRARVGDTLDVHVSNSEDSAFIHSVDFHAATGPGGGAAASQVEPGHTKSFKFKALVPGLYVYHCATPMVAHHIANGMYGLILVEPEEGLPPVDREFYVVQGEIYTQEAFGQRGRQEFSVEKLLNERPEYFIFNGSVGALSKLHPLKAKVGETVRIFFGVGGPNYTSSFHVIGEIFDRVYNMGDVLNPPMRGVQTITVPAGGAAIVEFKLDVPGNYILVDHALSRAERGLIGILQVEGQPNPEIFEGQVDPNAAH
ncbi:MAG: copper-containing nitrite reductase [Xanthobacteraceae bacterium]